MIGELSKVCPDCPERGPQPLSNFYRNTAGGHFKRCKPCQSKRNNHHHNDTVYCSGCGKRVIAPNQTKCHFCLRIAKPPTELDHRLKPNKRLIVKCANEGCRRMTTTENPLCCDCRNDHSGETRRAGKKPCPVCYDITDCRPRVGLCPGCNQPFREEQLERPSVIGSALGAML